jgi:hypothetical protein
MVSGHGSWFIIAGIVLVIAFEQMQILLYDMHKADSGKGGNTAVTYYLDSESGRDSNHGTSPENAWKSLKHVNEVIFNPGDRILLKAGTRYSGQLKPQGSGKQGKPIIVDMYGVGGKPRFDDLLIEGCHIVRCERNGIIGSGYWRRDQWYPSLNVVIRKNLLEQVPGDGIVPIACDGALVEHNVMRDCPRLLPDGDAAAGIWPWSCDNTVIQFNEVSDHKSPWDAQGFDSDWNCRNTIIQYNYAGCQCGIQ